MSTKSDGKIDPNVTTRWIIGVSATWIILTLLVDLGETRELGAGLAILVATSVILIHGPTAIQHLGFSGST